MNSLPLVDFKKGSYSEGDIANDDASTSNTQHKDEEPMIKSIIVLYLLYALFGIIVVFSVCVVYLIALFFARSIVPLIVKYFIKVPGFIVFSSEMAKTNNKGKGEIATLATMFVFGILAFLPLFQLLLHATIKVFTSFFTTLWKSLDLEFIKNFVTTRVEQKGTLKTLFIQLGWTIALFLLIIISLFE